MFDEFIKYVAVDVENPGISYAEIITMHNERVAKSLSNPRYDYNGRLICKLIQAQKHSLGDISYINYNPNGKHDVDTCWVRNTRVHEVSGPIEGVDQQANISISQVVNELNKLPKLSHMRIFSDGSGCIRVDKIDSKTRDEMIVHFDSKENPIEVIQRTVKAYQEREDRVAKENLRKDLLLAIESGKMSREEISGIFDRHNIQ